MKQCILIVLVATTTLCASAQSVVYVPAPSIPGQSLPFSQYGVMLGGYSPEVQTYAIDINGDGVVDYTLNVNPTLAGSDQFSITPMGNNSVLAYVDQYGAANAANLGAGAVVGSQSSSLNPIWANSGNSYPPVLNYTIATGVIGDPFLFGTFVNTTGFVGLQFWVGNQAYYVFLQMDTRFSPNSGGLYQGYGWNTTPGDSITTTYFRDLIQVPEPSIFALLALSGVAAGLVRWKHSKQ